MKRRPKPLLLTLILLPIIAFAAFYFSRSQQMPSEAEILANFKTHKAIFRQLVRMSKSDRIIYVSNSSGRHRASDFSDPDKGDELPAKRVQQYAALMQKIGVTSLRHSDGKPLRFNIASGQRGLMRDWHMGIVFENPFTGAPSRAVPLVASAYQTPPKAPPFNPIFYAENFTFSKIEPRWFLYRSES